MAQDEDRPAPARRELKILLLVGGFGLLVLPFVIYAVGAATLGPYDGGLGAFLSTLYGQFVRFAPGAWALLLGPYLLFQAVRLLTRPIRHRG
jgi:hypothetical protein